MADENKIYFDENGKAFTRPNSDTQNNQEIQEQDFKTRDDYLQALATKAWEDYASKADFKPSWQAEESDKAVNTIKRPFQFSNYLSHKVAEPIYKGVDVVAKRIGDKVGDVISKIKGYSASDRVKALMKQYDEMNGDNIDFGDNANREGYDKAGEYYGAKDKYEQDYQTYRNALNDPMAWYADANGEDVLSEPQDPNSQFASLTGTGSYQNWKPESKVGKIAKGASGITGDMLPEMLEGWGGEVAMGALSPVYAKAKEYIQAKKLGTEASVEPMIVSEGNGLTIKEPAEYAPRKARESYELRKGGEEIASMRKNRGRFNKAKKQLTTDEYDELLKKVDRQDPQRYIDEAIAEHNANREGTINFDRATQKADYRQGLLKPERGGVNRSKIAKVKKDIRNKELEHYILSNEGEIEYPEIEEQLDALYDQLEELKRTNNGGVKPLPNPAAQRAEALARNRQLAQEAEFNQALADLTEGKRLKDLSLDDMDDIIEQAEMRAKGAKARIKLSDTDNMVEIPIAKKPAQEWWEVHDPFKYDTGGFVEDAIEHAPTTIQNAFYDVASAEDADKIVRRLSRAVRNGVLKTDKDIESALIDILDDYFGGGIR